MRLCKHSARRSTIFRRISVLLFDAETSLEVLVTATGMMTAIGQKLTSLRRDFKRGASLCRTWNPQLAKLLSIFAYACRQDGKKILPPKKRYNGSVLLGRRRGAIGRHWKKMLKDDEDYMIEERKVSMFILLLSSCSFCPHQSALWIGRWRAEQHIWWSRSASGPRKTFFFNSREQQSSCRGKHFRGWRYKSVKWRRIRWHWYGSFGYGECCIICFWRS